MEDGYEYKTIKVPPATGTKGDRRRRDEILTQWGEDGWEVTTERPKGVLEFGWKDSVTLRRKTS